MGSVSTDEAREQMESNQGQLFAGGMSSMLLRDKAVFLTGGADGTGLECAKAYVREGALVTSCVAHPGGPIGSFSTSTLFCWQKLRFAC